MIDILIKLVNNCLLFKNNMKYEWVKFIQTIKISKRSINIIFNNPNLALIQQYLSYKNVTKKRILLIKRLYDKVIW